MERLINQNLNTPEEYNRIYFQRKKAGLDEFDLRRWKLLLRYYRGGKLVDLGCLDSLASVIAKQRYPESDIWAIDVALEALVDMQKQYPEINWQREDVYDTKFPSNFFDYAIAGELIEHLEEPERFLREAFRILKKGGILALSTPREEKLGEIDKDHHLWSFSINDIRKLLNPFGKVKIRILRSQYLPVYKYHHRNILAYCSKI